MELKQKEKQFGYDPEELYFEKLNRELINKIKEKNSASSEVKEAQVIPFPAQKKSDRQAA